MIFKQVYTSVIVIDEQCPPCVVELIAQEVTDDACAKTDLSIIR